MCHYWNDFINSCVVNLNEYESKSDRPLLIANCFTIELFTMCPVLVRGTHFHKDCHRRGVLFLSEALILGKHYIVQINGDNGHTGYLICSKYSWFAVKQYLNCYKNYIKPQWINSSPAEKRLECHILAEKRVDPTHISVSHHKHRQWDIGTH